MRSIRIEISFKEMVAHLDAMSDLQLPHKSLIRIANGVLTFELVKVFNKVVIPNIETVEILLVVKIEI